MITNLALYQSKATRTLFYQVLRKVSAISRSQILPAARFGAKNAVLGSKLLVICKLQAAALIIRRHCDLSQLRNERAAIA